MKPRIKPRNPYVAIAKFRKAGPHTKPVKAQRRQDHMALCTVVKQLSKHWHKRISIESASANASANSGCGAVDSAPRLGRVRGFAEHAPRRRSRLAVQSQPWGKGSLVRATLTNNDSGVLVLGECTAGLSHRD